MTNGNELKNEDSFKLVTSRRKKKRRPVNTPRSDYLILNGPEIDEKSVIRRIEEANIDLRLSEYFQTTLQKLNSFLKETNKTIQEIICFGIGHFSDCSISRHQFAYILALRDELKIPQAIFHEPILHKPEINILNHFNCKVFEKNLEGKLSIASDSSDLILVYSPHCPKQLTNNLLWKNWSKQQLERIVFIGNSFSNLLNSTPNRLLEIDANFIVKIHPFTNEIELPNSFRHTDIFNDTAIHTFFTDNSSSLSESFWEDGVKEPIYLENTELITTELIAKLNIN